MQSSANNQVVMTDLHLRKMSSLLCLHLQLTICWSWCSLRLTEPQAPPVMLWFWGCCLWKKKVENHSSLSQLHLTTEFIGLSVCGLFGGGRVEGGAVGQQSGLELLFMEPVTNPLYVSRRDLSSRGSGWRRLCTNLIQFGFGVDCSHWAVLSVTVYSSGAFVCFQLNTLTGLTCPTTVSAHTHCVCVCAKKKLSASSPNFERKLQFWEDNSINWLI